ALLLIFLQGCGGGDVGGVEEAAVGSGGLTPGPEPINELPKALVISNIAETGASTLECLSEVHSIQTLYTATTSVSVDFSNCVDMIVSETVPKEIPIAVLAPGERLIYCHLRSTSLWYNPEYQQAYDPEINCESISAPPNADM